MAKNLKQLQSTIKHKPRGLYFPYVRNAQKEFLIGQSSRSHVTYRRPSVDGLDWIEQGLTSHQTHYRSYRGRVFMGQVTQPTVSKH